MREVPVAHLVSGDILAKPIYSRNGVVLLDTGTVLTDSYIQRLRGLKIDHVSLRFANGSPAVREAFDLSQADWEMPDIARLKSDDKARQEAMRAALAFTDTMRGLERISLPVPQEEFRRRFKELIGEVISTREYTEELGVMLLSDPLLFEQAMQVSMCAVVIGTAKNYESSHLYTLTLGSLFCDLGMTRLPSDLTKVTRELTKAERLKVRSHTTEGYRILTKMKGVPLEAAKVALQHHERYRGEGYPFGLKHAAISELSQIVGIADVYNALVSKRHHRKAYAVEEATEYLFAAGNYEFDLNLIQMYLRHLTIYPVSTRVLMNSGQSAFVVDTSNRAVKRPVVQIYQEADGSVIPSPYLVDLELDPYLSIIRRISD